MLAFLAHPRGRSDAPRAAGTVRGPRPRSTPDRKLLKTQPRPSPTQQATLRTRQTLGGAEGGNRKETIVGRSSSGQMGKEVFLVSIHRYIFASVSPVAYTR